MRRSLIDALADCAGHKSSVYQFLSGLSSDELQFIAEYLGSYVLGQRPASPVARCSEDRELKLIVLREYLAISALDQGMAHGL